MQPFVQLSRPLFWAVCLTFGTTTAAQSVIFTASLNSDTVNLDQIFEVTFTIEGGNANGFECPEFQDFELVYGPNVSTQMSITNGSMSQKVSYTYGLQAKDQGVFVIEPAKTTVQNKRLQTDFIKVVVDANYEPRQQPTAEDPFDDFWERSPFPKPGWNLPKVPNQTPQPPQQQPEKKKRKVIRI